MAPTADNAPLSDTEAAERPVREQLKKASLAALPNDGPVPPEGNGTDEQAQATTEASPKNGDRGRLQRKRSFEEVESEDAAQATSEPTRLHTRKRSRDSTAEEDALNNGRKVSGERLRESTTAASGAEEANGAKDVSTKRPSTPDVAGNAIVETAAEAMASPKTKRSRLHSTTADENGRVVPAADSKTEGAADADTSKSSKTSPSKVPPTSGFANTSATSPFGTLAGGKSPSAEQPQTSQSAFASSGFGSLAGSTSSSFGAVGKTSGGFGTGGGFGSKSPLAEPSKDNEKSAETPSSAFGGALGQKSAFAAAPAAPSGFGSSALGFGKLSGGLGGGFGGGLGGSSSPFGGTGASTGGLSTFASGKSTASFGTTSKPSKPFGAPAEEAAEDETEEAAGDADDESGGVRSPALSQPQEEDKQDERFYQQHVETGEEDEATEYSCRAKLYNYTALEDGKKEWRERGLGVLRLNVKRNTDDGKPRARFLMRADGSHRVVLNTPVKKEITFGAASGGPPQGGLMLFMGTIGEGKGLEMLQLKIRQLYAMELHGKIVELQEQM